MNRDLREFNWVDPFPLDGHPPLDCWHGHRRSFDIGDALASSPFTRGHLAGLEEDPYIPEVLVRMRMAWALSPRSTINSDLWTELLVYIRFSGSVLSVLLDGIQSWLERRAEGHRNN